MADKKKRIQVTNQQFFAICNELQNQREVVVRECHSKIGVATFIKQRLGIDAGVHAIENALETTKIKLEIRRAKRTNRGGKNNTRVLTGSLIRLYKKLGEEVPEELNDLLSRCNHGQSENEGKTILPIPVHTVPPPQTIAVVTPNSRPNQPR